MGGDPPLAVMVAGNARARFVDSYPIDALVEYLRPVETDFLAATVGQGGENFEWDPSEVLDPAVRAHIAAADAEPR